jgi:DNA repair protein RecO (recombination protein O)
MTRAARIAHDASAGPFMSLHTTEALILRTYKLNDADRIVVFLTRDRGKKRGVAKGARRLRSKFGGALEPLTRAMVVYFEKENRELVSLNTVDTLRSPLSAKDPEALGYVGYLAELIDEWAPDSDPNETLFRLGAAVLEALTEPVPVERLVRYFEYWLLRLQGVYPSLAACQECGQELTDGARLTAPARPLVCRDCAAATGSIALSAQALAFLRAAGSVGPGRLGSIDLTMGAARELEAVHRVLIAWHLEKELRSTRVLRHMYQQRSPQ